MLVADLLLDSATTEMSMYQQARDACQKLMRYVYDGHQPFHEVELGNFGDFYAYRSHDVGIAEDVLILIGVLKENTVGMSGMVVDFGQLVFGYKGGIVVRCMRHLSLEEMRLKVNTTGFMKVFEHEYLHVLDNKRTAGRIVARGGTDPKNNPQQYYNDPGEFNAYYHDIAKDMLAVIDAAAKEPQDAKDYMELFGMTGDWKKDISGMLTRDVYVQRFTASLRPERRKALLRRLYRLYQQMIEATR